MVVIYTYIYILAKWVKCSLMAKVTGVQSQVESYQRFKKIIIDTFLLKTQHYNVRIKGKWNNPKKVIALTSLPRCSSYRKKEFSDLLRPRSPTLYICYLFFFFTEIALMLK